MKTIEQIEDRALAIAYGHFHCESGEPWEPFENWSKDEIDEETEALANVIVLAMRWAQE
jgi:hypothetical protein